ncbi:MAG: hypothetical protein B655_0063 [Methanobacterium sp. Maddingley MBC34]|nr:MAG: hypothetical protein B655_0063 [Methanobacterium sp. Maddingley MBC34]
MMEVKGMNKDQHGVLAFDGRVIEIFGFGHRGASQRIHIDQLKAIIKESNGLSIVYEDGIIAIGYTEGCENMGEFIESLVSTSNNPDLMVK